MFLLSKIAWRLLCPSTLIIAAILLGAVMHLLVAVLASPSLGCAAQALLIAGITSLAIAVLTPIGPSLLRRLELSHPALPLSDDERAPPTLAGIILLGGPMRTATIDSRMEETATDSIQRVLYASELAHRFPCLPIFICGGQPFVMPGARNEADMLSSLLIRLGVERHLITIETSSRNTDENAQALAKLLLAREGSATTAKSFILVTSAFHMRRAVAEFERAGFTILPAPTDWRCEEAGSLITQSPLRNLGMLDLVVREYLGLVALAARR